MREKKPFNTFTKGEFVRAPGFRTTLTILDGPNKKGEYLIEMGSFKVWVHESRVTPATKRPKEDNAKISAQQHPLVKSAPERRTVRLDFHGHTTAKAIEKLDAAIDRALLENTSLIEVVHGIGKGAVKTAVHKFLAKSKHVKEFHLDDTNPGVTKVYI